MTAFLKRKYHVFSKKYPVSQLWDRSGHNTAQELPAETNWASCIQVSAKCLSQKLIPNLPSSKKNTKHGSWTPLLQADLWVEAQGTASFSNFSLHSQNQPTTTNKNTEKRSADLLTRLLLDLYLPSQGWQLAFHRHQTKSTRFIFIWPPHFLFIWPILYLFDPLVSYLFDQADKNALASFTDSMPLLCPVRQMDQVHSCLVPLHDQTLPPHLHLLAAANSDRT